MSLDIAGHEFGRCILLSPILHGFRSEQFLIVLNPNVMQQKDVLTNRAIAFLQNNQLSITDLADKLCICPRHTHRILEHLKERGYKLTYRFVERKKILSLSSDGASLCTALSIDESKAVGKALTGSDRNLRQGIEKLLFIANNNPYDL